MSKKVFTEKEIEILSNNPFVKSVSSKGITYTDDFKHLFIAQNKKGKLPREIFEECGYRYCWIKTSSIIREKMARSLPGEWIRRTKG